MRDSTLKLVAVVVPLGLDTLGVALALGLAGLPTYDRNRIAALFTLFETAMPLAGLALGAPLGDAVGSAAEYVAAALVAGIGVYMLVGHRGADDTGRMLSMTQRGAGGALVLGLTISMDELAIGFSAGLLRLPLAPMLAAIAIQAYIVTQVGVRVGARVGRWHEHAERLAGVALLALGVLLLTLRLDA